MHGRFEPRTVYSLQLLTVSTFNHSFDDLCDSVKFKILHHVRRTPKKLHLRPGVSGLKTYDGRKNRIQFALIMPAAPYVPTEFKFRRSDLRFKA